MEGFCKGCLIKYEDQSELLQYTEKNRRLYIYATGLQVKRDDKFPFQLCKHCCVKMKLACNFKKQCRTSDKRYKNYFALKEAGEITDFCTFLKNNDDSLMFRFPLASGNSTPAVQRTRDEDNESTCTSIRNFMSEIVREDEIPDTEARIIREVIEEEADVLDDSLDSHWLQDDASNDNDFRLDLSFSPFSTPRSVNNDYCYTPHKLKEELEKEFPENEELMRNLASAKEMIQNEIENLVEKDEKVANSDTEPRLVNFYVETKEENYEISDHVDKGKEITETEGCQIDMNLENALRNDEKEEFPLAQLLATPPIHRGISAPSTPTINNILFGDKLDDENNYASTPKPGESIVSHEVVDATDILEDFFSKEQEKDVDLDYEDNEYNTEILALSEEETEETESELLYDYENFFCNKCKKKFASMKSMRIHCAIIHKIKDPNRKHCPRKAGICDYCGRYFSDRSYLAKHIQVHMKPEGITTCDYCSMEFSAPSKLRMHMTTHIGTPALLPRDKELKNCICSICGTTLSNPGNLRTHMRRHTNAYQYQCHECGKGYYRKTDLERHTRTHTGAKPFQCQICNLPFARRDVLNRHLKLHYDERKFKCKYCAASFVTKFYLLRHMNIYTTCMNKRLEAEKRGEITENMVTVQDYDKIPNKCMKKPEKHDENMMTVQEYDKIPTKRTRKRRKSRKHDEITENIITVEEYDKIPKKRMRKRRKSRKHDDITANIVIVQENDKIPKHCMKTRLKSRKHDELSENTVTVQDQFEYDQISKKFTKKLEEHDEITENIVTVQEYDKNPNTFTKKLQIEKHDEITENIITVEEDDNISKKRQFEEHAEISENIASVEGNKIPENSDTNCLTVVIGNEKTIYNFAIME